MLCCGLTGFLTILLALFLKLEQQALLLLSFHAESTNLLFQITLGALIDLDEIQLAATGVLSLGFELGEDVSLPYEVVHTLLLLFVGLV